MGPDQDAKTRLFTSLLRMRYAALVNGLQTVADPVEVELRRMLADSDPGRRPGAGAAEAFWASSEALAACMEIIQMPMLERLELGLKIMSLARSAEMKSAMRAFRESLGSDDFDKNNRIRTGIWPWPRPHFEMDEELFENDIQDLEADANPEHSDPDAPTTLSPLHLPDDEEVCGNASPPAEPPLLGEAYWVRMQMQSTRC